MDSAGIDPLDGDWSPTSSQPERQKQHRTDKSSAPDPKHLDFCPPILPIRPHHRLHCETGRGDRLFFSRDWRSRRKADISSVIYNDKWRQTCQKARMISGTLRGSVCTRLINLIGRGFRYRYRGVNLLPCGASLTIQPAHPKRTRSRSPR
jgi:hypothetical protein